MRPAEHGNGRPGWPFDAEAVVPAAHATAHVYGEVLESMVLPSDGANARDRAADSAEPSLADIERLAEQAAATMLLDHVAFAVIAVDERAAVRFANAPASRLLAAGSRLVCQDGLLQTARPEDDAALRRAIAAATRPLAVGMPAEWLRLSGDDGQPFGVVVLPACSSVREPAQAATESGAALPALAVFVLTDPERE